MYAKGTKQVREYAAISDCTKISCIRKVKEPRIQKMSAYEIFWIYSTSIDLKTHQAQISVRHFFRTLPWPQRKCTGQIKAKMITRWPCLLETEKAHSAEQRSLRSGDHDQYNSYSMQTLWVSADYRQVSHGLGWPANAMFFLQHNLRKAIFYLAGRQR